MGMSNEKKIESTPLLNTAHIENNRSLRMNFVDGLLINHNEILQRMLVKR